MGLLFLQMRALEVALRARRRRTFGDRLESVSSLHNGSARLESVS